MAAPKYMKNNAGVLTEQAATVTAVADSVVATDGTGTIPAVLMPPGITAPTASVVSSENLAAGDLVNVYNNAGVGNVRKADASTTGKEAHGFVLSAVTSPAAATVYFGDPNTAVTGLTPGAQFLSAATAGKSTITAPSAAGQIVQRVGTATSATVLIFEPQPPYVLS